MKVIIVDDDPMICTLLRKLIQRKGHTVLTYASPLDCPIYQDNLCPCEPSTCCADIIISDYNMPAVNGVEFLNKVYNRGCRCRNFALITGKGLDEPDLILTARLGTKYFLKPIDYTQLYDWIDRVQQQTF